MVNNKLINTTFEMSASLNIGNTIRVISLCFIETFNLYLHFEKKINMDSQHDNNNSVIHDFHVLYQISSQNLTHNALTSRLCTMGQTPTTILA